MSTRCQIKINDNKNMIYKHCDGTPANILPVLIDVIKDGMNKNIKNEKYYLKHFLYIFSNKIGEEEKMLNSITKDFKENDRFSIKNNVENSKLFITNDFYNYAFLYEINLNRKIINVSGYEDFKFDIDKEMIICDSEKYSKKQQEIRENLNYLLDGERRFKNINYNTYSIIFNEVMEMFDKMYRLGYEEGVNNNE